MIPLDRRRLTVSGGELGYVDLGEGSPVLLLHGFPTSSFLWRRETWLLAQRMRVIAPDLLGYGESAKLGSADLSEPAQARYVGELLNQLGIQELAVVGHEIGGGVAQVLALDPGLMVRTLILLDSVCFDVWPVEGIRMLQQATPEQETAEFVEGVVRRMFDLGVRHREGFDEDALDEYLRPWCQDPPAFFRAVRGVTGLGLAGRESELAALDIPTLILWGEEDPFLPAELAERLGALIAGSTTGLLPGCSHFVNEDAPQTVGPLIFEYLRSRYLHERHEHAAPGPVPVFLERPPGSAFSGDGETAR